MALVGAGLLLASVLYLVTSCVARPTASPTTPVASAAQNQDDSTPVVVDIPWLTPLVISPVSTPEVQLATSSGDGVAPTSTGVASTLWIPSIQFGNPPVVDATLTPTPTPYPFVVPASTTAPQATNAPQPTRGPIRITKLGLGVYASGGGMLPILDQARPSVILLMDPTVDFAREVHRRFPKAFIVGRVFEQDQKLDNPAQRGSDFADRVSILAVPLKGVVDAWVSYNEVAGGDQPDIMTAYNTFQVAFANRLQDTYGVAAVAGNDGPRSVPAELYPQYFAGAIQASRYFGVHIYSDAGITSLQNPMATDQVFYYRQIKAALDSAGIKSGPFIATEIGLFNGWHNAEDDRSMAADFIWVADQMNADPYVLGMTVFGAFNSTRWANFDVVGSAIPTLLGNYNSAR